MDAETKAEITAESLSGILRRLGVSASLFSTTLRYIKMAKADPGKISDLKIQWASELVTKYHARFKITGEAVSDRPLVLVGNHVSYFDIPILMSQVRDISFVSKKEVKYWPVIGQAATLVDTIFVNRGSYQSRTQVREQLAESLKWDKRRMVVFPSGTTSVNEHIPWKKGSFVVAQEAGARVQPFRLKYTPQRPVAYIDDDFFPTHLYALAALPDILVELEFGQPIEITDPVQQSADLMEWTREWFQKT